MFKHADPVFHLISFVIIIAIDTKIIMETGKSRAGGVNLGALRDISARRQKASPRNNADDSLKSLF